MFITEIFSKEQLAEIGMAVTAKAKELGAAEYFREMAFRDGWFNLVVDVYPNEMDHMLDYVDSPNTVIPPDDELGQVFFTAERLVFGVSVAEYKARPRIIDYQTYVVIRKIMRHADALSGFDSVY